MIIYNVTVNVDYAYADEWLQWMKEVHVPDVMRSGMFVQNNIYRILNNEDTGGQNFSVQYSCESMQKYEQYRDQFAASLQADALNKFANRFVAFRTLLELV